MADLLCALPLAVLGLLFGGGEEGGSVDGDFGIFSVLNNTAVTMNGEINERTQNDFNDLLEEFPDLNLIILEDCPGSADDDTNLAVSRQIHQQGIRTHLRGDSLIESGAVDLYLAGTKRTMDNVATVKVGVHAWADQDDTPATDFPMDSQEHQPYIDYYVFVGFTEQEARDFYFFTINAAPSDGIHYMTEQEIATYGLVLN